MYDYRRPLKKSKALQNTNERNHMTIAVERYGNIHTSHLAINLDLTSDTVTEERQNNKKLLLKIFSSIKYLVKTVFSIIFEYLASRCKITNDILTQIFLDVILIFIGFVGCLGFPYKHLTRNLEYNRICE